MRLFQIFIAAFFATISCCMAEAKEYDSRPYSHFATGRCKTDSCFSRHSSGTYRFPYHYGHRR